MRRFGKECKGGYNFGYGVLLQDSRVASVVDAGELGLGSREDWGDPNGNAGRSVVVKMVSRLQPLNGEVCTSRFDIPDDETRFVPYFVEAYSEIVGVRSAERQGIAYPSAP
jgi:hypothetical protein